MTTSLGAADPAAVQTRTIRTLVVSQAIGAVGVTIGVATASLLARDISGSESMAGLAQTFQVLGTAVAAFLLARLMRARGRRIGLVTGYLLGAAGALLAVVAGVVDSMLVLLVGAVLLGATTAANNGSRYTATDLAEEEHRARALSVVVWATTIGAVAGPNLTGVGASFARSAGIPELTGGFAIGAVALVMAACWLGVRLRPDPLLLAQASAPVEPADTSTRSWSRFAATVRDVPAVGAAVVAMASAHAAMVTVMIMTPLHMEHGGAHLEVIGLVISLHVLGMFAFSPLVGAAADRWGRSPVLMSGGVVLLVSLATVSASTVIADRTPFAARTDVQGTSDMAMSLTAAGGGALAGVIVQEFGYPVLAAFAALLGSLVVVAGLATRRPEDPASNKRSG